MLTNIVVCRRPFTPRADPAIDARRRSHDRDRNRKISTYSNVSIYSSMSTDSFLTETGPANPLQPAYLPTHFQDIDEEGIDVELLPPDPSHHLGCLPHPMVYVAYAGCAVVSIAAIITTLMYGVKFEPDVALDWLLSSMSAILICGVVLEPVRVVISALISAACCREVIPDGHDSPPVIESNEQIQPGKLKPVRGYALIRARREAEKERKLRSLMYSALVYALFLLVLMLQAYTTTTQTHWQLQNHISQEVNNTGSFQAVRDYNSFWTWLRVGGLGVVHGEELNPQESQPHLLAPAVLTQLQSSSVSCPAHDKLSADHVFPSECYSSWHRRDNAYHDNSSTSEFSGRWRGEFAAYHGTEGISVTLGDSYNESLSIIDSLLASQWLDRATRMVLLQFTVYSASYQVLTTVGLLVEFPISSAAFTTSRVYPVPLGPYTGSAQPSYITCQVLLGLCSLYLLVSIVRSIHRLRCDFLWYLWAWVDITLFSMY